MSFKNISNEIKILDIIPDLINQPGVTLNDEIKEELDTRDINFPAFDIADVCGTNKIEAHKRSNARCYAFLADYAEEDIESCDTGLITSDGEEINEGTVGDVLCERMFNSTFPDEATRIKMYEKPWNTGEGVGTSERGLRACGEKPPKDAKEKRKTRFNCLKELNEAKYPPVYIG